jgi:hypothetical protein
MLRQDEVYIMFTNTIEVPVTSIFLLCSGPLDECVLGVDGGLEQVWDGRPSSLEYLVFNGGVTAWKARRQKAFSAW